MKKIISMSLIAGITIIFLSACSDKSRKIPTKSPCAFLQEHSQSANINNKGKLWHFKITKKTQIMFLD